MSMMRSRMGVAALVCSLACRGQALEQPVVKPGDTWKYRITVEKGPGSWNQFSEEYAVLRATTDRIYSSAKQSGSTQAARDQLAGLDWSRYRDVNGKETLVNQPMAFPLSTGKSWEVSYTEQHPNKAHRVEQLSSTYTVVGYEPVEVPAGKFNALKVEAEGHWNAESEPRQTVVQGVQTGAGGANAVTQVQKDEARTSTGRMYKAFWYVPEIKRWVKAVEEFYSSGGVRSERSTQELESYKFAQ